MNESIKHVHRSKSIIELMSVPQRLDSSKDRSQAKLQDDYYHYQNYDDDYLLDLIDYDFSNNKEEEASYQVLGEVEEVSSMMFREFPVEDGYVRVPLTYPGLNISMMEPPDLKLWTAESAFKEQVRWEIMIILIDSVPALQIVPHLYMFLPSALLGFIIGMILWTISLVIMRLYGSARKGFTKENQTYDLDLKLNAVCEENLWKKIR